MNKQELITRLSELVTPFKKGSSGYVTLAASERVTAHKINLIINDLTKGME